MLFKPIAIRVANATPWQQNVIFLTLLGIFFANFYCCFIFVAKGRSTEILVKLNIDLCDILETSFSAHTHYLFDFDNIRYDKRSQILYHMILHGSDI